MTETEKNETSIYNSKWIGAGLALGIVFGVIFDNLAIGLVFGIAIGMGLHSYKKEKH